MRVIEAIATALGLLVRFTVLLIGPALVTVGVWMFSPRVAFIVLGAMLILVQVQTTKRSRGAK